MYSPFKVQKQKQKKWLFTRRAQASSLNAVFPLGSKLVQHVCEDGANIGNSLAHWAGGTLGKLPDGTSENSLGKAMRAGFPMTFCSILSLQDRPRPRVEGAQLWLWVSCLHLCVCHQTVSQRQTNRNKSEKDVRLRIWKKKKKNLCPCHRILCAPSWSCFLHLVDIME